MTIDNAQLYGANPNLLKLKYGTNTNLTGNIYTGSNAQLVSNYGIDTYKASPTTVAKQEAPKEKKMGFLDGVGHFFKGAAKALGGAVCSVVPGASIVAKGLGWKDAPSFSPKNALIAAGTIALCIVCPPAGVAIAAVGVAAGTVKVAKGAVELATADTKEAQEAACEEMGGGTLEVGLSVAGAKAGLKNCGNTTAAIAAKSEEGASILTKVKSVGKAFGQDTGESLVRNTGSLGENISTNLKDATSFGDKIKAVKNGVVDTSKETSLYKNIKGDDSLGYIKGTKKTVTDAVSDLKKTGFESVENVANNATKSLKDKVSKLDDSVAVSKLDDSVVNLKEMPLKSASNINKFMDALKNIDTKALSKDTIAELESLKSLAKTAENKLSKFEKTDKYTTQKNKIDEDPKITVLTEAEQAALNAKLEKIAKLEGKGSAITGAKENIKTWAKNTIKSNSQESINNYNKYIKEHPDSGLKEMKISNNAEVSINATNRKIEKINETIEEQKKIISDKNKTEAEVTAAKDKLASAKGELSSLNTRLKLQENVYNARSLKNGNATLSQKIAALNGSVTPAIITNLDTPSGTATAATLPQRQYFQQTQTMTNTAYEKLPEIGYDPKTEMWT